MKSQYSKILMALVSTLAVIGLVGCGKMKIKETNENEVSEEAGLAQAMQFQEFGGERKLSLRTVQAKAYDSSSYKNSMNLQVSGELKVDSQIVHFQLGGESSSNYFTTYTPYLLIEGRCLTVDQPAEPCAKLALSIVNYSSDQTDVFQTGVVLTRVTDITKADPQVVMYKVKAHKELKNDSIDVQDLAFQLWAM